MSAKELSKLPAVHLNDLSRRDFFTKTSILAGGFLALGWPFLTGRSRSAFAAQPQQVVQSGGAVRYRLELNRAIVGPLQSMDGGVVSGEIITYQDGNSPIFRKRVGRLKYEDIVFTCGASLSAPFFQWLGETLSQQGRRKSGAIVAVNQNGQIIDRREFQNALVNEVVFPGLDVTSNEPGYFKVTVTPERIRYQSSSSGQTVPPAQTNQAVLSSSKFRLLIEGLEQACTFVRRIEPLVVKQEIIHYVDGGSAGESRISAGRPEVGNLVVTLPQHQAGPFTAWFSSFVLQGQSAGNVKQGVLEFSFTEWPNRVSRSGTGQSWNFQDDSGDSGRIPPSPGRNVLRNDTTDAVSRRRGRGVSATRTTFTPKITAETGNRKATSTHSAEKIARLALMSGIIKESPVSIEHNVFDLLVHIIREGSS